MLKGKLGDGGHYLLFFAGITEFSSVEILSRVAKMVYETFYGINQEGELSPIFQALANLYEI